MKKYLLSFFLILSFAAFALSQKSVSSDMFFSQNETTSGTPPLPASSSQNSASPEKPLVTIVKKKTQTPASSPSSNTPAPVPPVSKPKGQYRDGTYDGSAVSEYYGIIQVAAVIQNGRLTDVQFLQYPTDRSTSLMINKQALPQLKSEAIQVQSANIDAVSGASETSPAFIQSLASALAMAKN